MFMGRENSFFFNKLKGDERRRDLRSKQKKIMNMNKKRVNFNLINYFFVVFEKQRSFFLLEI